MQPTQFFPTADLSAIDVSALDRATASPATRELAAAFAQLLGDNTAPGRPLPAAAGERVPESGNILPVPPDTATDAPIDPEEIVASLQRELEGLTDEQVTLTGDPEEPPAPEIDIDIQLVTETIKPTPTPAPPTPVVMPPGTVDTLEIVNDTAGKDPAEKLLPPAAPLPVELPKTTAPPTPPVVLVPQGQAEIRQALPREEQVVRPPAAPAAPAAPALPAGAAAANDGSMDVVHARTLNDEAIAERKRNQTPSTATPLVSADKPTATTETAVRSRPLAGAPVEPVAQSQPVPAALSGAVTPGAADAASIAALASPAARQSAPPPVADLAMPLTASIDLPVQESGWDKAISERVVMMANHKLQNAEIRLTPAELGPLRIQLAIEDGAAKVGFAAQHALTRDAIEQALPRLREMLAVTGLTLAEAFVGDEGLDYSASHDTDGEAQSAGAIAGEDVAPEVNLVADAPQVVRTSEGLVDTFV